MNYRTSQILSIPSAGAYKTMRTGNELQHEHKVCCHEEKKTHANF